MEMLSHYGSFTVRTYRDDLDRYSEIIFHESDIVAELCREFLFAAAVGKVCMPSLEFGVYRLDVGISVERPLV